VFGVLRKLPSKKEVFGKAYRRTLRKLIDRGYVFFWEDSGTYHMNQKGERLLDELKG
jgi:hypothetical protein